MIKLNYNVNSTTFKTSTNIMEVSERITNKAIRTIASKGNNIAIQLLEYKQIHLKEDLAQSVLVAMIENKVKVIDYMIYISLIKAHKTNTRTFTYLKDKLKTTYQTIQKTMYQEKQIQTTSLYIENEDGTTERASISEYLIYTIEQENTNYNKSQDNKTTLNDLQLSKKELQYFTLKAQGKTNKEIAELCDVNIKAVENCITRLRQRLNVVNKNNKEKKAIKEQKQVKQVEQIPTVKKWIDKDYTLTKLA